MKASWAGLVFALAAQAAPAFTDSEVRAILSHGPWPMPWTPDPSNRVSGSAQAVDLGERLFFERRLSVNGEVSCSRCHLPERNWTDGEARARGLAHTDRNAPSVANVRYQRWFGWDGANDSLWAQSIRPILDPRELGSSAEQVAKLIRDDRDLSCRYAKVFGAPPSSNNEKVLVDAGKALAAFQETLVSGRTAFDEFRDALERGDRNARWRRSSTPRWSTTSARSVPSTSTSSRSRARSPTRSSARCALIPRPERRSWPRCGRCAARPRSCAVITSAPTARAAKIESTGSTALRQRAAVHSRLALSRDPGSVVTEPAVMLLLPFPLPGHEATQVIRWLKNFGQSRT